MVIRKSRTYFMELIKVGGLNIRIAQAGDITIALIINHDEDYVWFFSLYVVAPNKA
ncbi:MAG: hypothetical protein DHS20C17_34870 [Cyclobacteriaceae bacterium]|nr:MAG: hypothetical protein DHS20C17_34870 [Cyclobacteriaceae bacterium]